MESQIEALAQKAAAVTQPEDAQKFSQAALNLAHAYRILTEVKHWQGPEVTHIKVPLTAVVGTQGQ